jgi:hypothetical protein
VARNLRRWKKRTGALASSEWRIGAVLRRRETEKSDACISPTGHSSATAPSTSCGKVDAKDVAILPPYWSLV